MLAQQTIDLEEQIDTLFDLFFYEFWHYSDLTAIWLNNQSDRKNTQEKKGGGY
ncbi:hypothetical protein ACOZ0W_002889 [Cronobacter dublinensis]